jgi:hypothetical protein
MRNSNDPRPGWACSIADSDVPAMKKRLDPENGGVILMTDFLNVAAKSNPVCDAVAL